ncbi:MAG: V-type ATP synthase subunit I [Faecalibacterium sp.]|nr:V-type ATP synthase subunit I [Ruminococcus sp.]MCM1392077.1 V-type ATP synthase subunit I [Ruminococcus sp.]MCM1485002.1 V-type ATP synthase subunit I [Faecalibacterium sp.]
MAKIKLVHFELVALLEESKKLMEYLQRVGVTALENVEDEQLEKYHTEPISLDYQKKHESAISAVGVLEKYCAIKKSFIESFNDYTEIEYHEYKQLCDSVDDLMQICSEIQKLSDEIDEQKVQVRRLEALIESYRPWESLDIPMSSTRTAKSSIFIGIFKSQFSDTDIKTLLAKEIPEVEGIEAQVVSSSKFQTCAVIICHCSDADSVEEALKNIGFVKPENPAKKLVKTVIADYEKQIDEANDIIEHTTFKIGEYAGQYEKLRFLSDYYLIQKDRYDSIALAGTTQRVFFLEGYVPERNSEELKFEIEKRFTAQLELSEPDYENEDVPVLIQNGSFAGGVESISNMYSPVSNNDIDPNPIMAVFYYGLFGLMLSDGGYGILMIIFALVAKFKVKVSGNQKKFADFALYCGISTTFWGAMFGGWFGNLIPTLCTTFFGMENGPNLAIWFTPAEDSIKLLLFSFLFGIIHLFVGLAIRFYLLCKKHDYIGAFCDTIPVYVFVLGIAIVGKDFIAPVSAAVKSVGIKLLLIGAVLIVLTAGRSAKNILGKLGGGFYGLYNSATGYLGDILSYSRLLALNLVTGVIAQVVNMLSSITGNIFLFILIFILGHTINLAINLIGTYVHTCRLQYVEFFSKFYEGDGKSFTPFKINSKYFKIQGGNNQ